LLKYDQGRLFLSNRVEHSIPGARLDDRNLVGVRRIEKCVGGRAVRTASNERIARRGLRDRRSIALLVVPAFTFGGDLRTAIPAAEPTSAD
jgi:hypothetical protein